MTLKNLPILSMLLTLALPVSAQIEKKIPDDPYGITYDDVFENMHYDQPLRPQVHYTPITGQIGDATGLLLYKGTYHLFYMYDEWSRRRRYNKSWGHAVSNDLIYWEQRPQILNTQLDNAPGSGSGIVDWNNTLGLQTGVEKTIAVFYTDYGRGTSISFSRDAGKTWIRHKDNPVVPMPEGRNDRDALVFWYKPDQSWRMVLYEQTSFVFYKSADLLNWELLSQLDGFHECPDLFQLPVDGDESNKKWVLVEGNGLYRLGDFNGTEFIPETDKLEADYGNLYATQTWKHSYEGDGPVIQLSMISFPGQTAMHDRTWSMQQSFPSELTLKTINGEVRLCRNPIVGIKNLRYESHFWENETVNPGDNPLEDLDGDVFEINAVIDPGKASEFGFDIRGERLVYAVKDQRLTFMEKEAELVPMTIGSDEKIKISLIIDRGSVEVFANQGEVSISMLFYPDPSDMNLEFFSTAGSAEIDYLEVFRLQSIWLKREQELGYYR